MPGVRRVRLAITSHDFQSQSCKPEIYLLHVGGARIICNGIILISKGFNLSVSVFNQGSIDVYRPRGTLSSFLWNSLSLCSISFIVVGFWKCALSLNSSPKLSDMSTLSNAGNSCVARTASSSSSSVYWLIAATNQPSKL